MSTERYRTTAGRGYRRHPATWDETRCVYCGEPGESRDHFLPLKYAHLVTDLQHVNLQPLKFIVPACMSCNRIANDRVFRSVAGKRRAIHDRLREKNAKLIASPDWSDEELDELGPTLRQYIEGRRDERQRLLARLRFRPGYEIGPLPRRSR